MGEMRKKRRRDVGVELCDGSIRGHGVYVETRKRGEDVFVYVVGLFVMDLLTCIGDDSLEFDVQEYARAIVMGSRFLVEFMKTGGEKQWINDLGTTNDDMRKGLDFETGSEVGMNTGDSAKSNKRSKVTIESGARTLSGPIMVFRDDAGELLFKIHNEGKTRCAACGRRSSN